MQAMGLSLKFELAPPPPPLPTPSTPTAISTQYRKEDTTMVLKLDVIGVEKLGKQSGQKYIAFRTTKKDGTRVPLKFRKELNNIPKRPGKYVMEIESSTMNSRMTDYGEEWWVSADPISVAEFIPEDTAKDEF